MDEPTGYRIVIRGDAGERVLRPFADDFTVTSADGGTALVGPVRDAAHLHGLLVHLTALNAEVVSVNPVTSDPVTTDPVATDPVATDAVTTNPTDRSTPS